MKMRQWQEDGRVFQNFEYLQATGQKEPFRNKIEKLSKSVGAFDRKVGIGGICFCNQRTSGVIASFDRSVSSIRPKGKPSTHHDIILFFYKSTNLR